ncbi:MAG: hypothetical protein OXG37_08595 [Actinomycetia bacterium]|nr:hypothetical protein [Actinomycetes bacterium]
MAILGELRKLQQRIGDRRLVQGLLAAVAVAAVASTVLGLVLRDGGSPPRDEGTTAQLERAAAFGASHVLYRALPGGVVSAAEQTARYRTLVEELSAGSGFDADLIEALILLESAGQPDVIAGDDLVNASGLTQILAETATSFLGMRVDLERSRRLTVLIGTAASDGNEFAAEWFRARRREIDERFDPAKAVAGTLRYLTQAYETFGRVDLSLVSYHMGIGNLLGVLRAFAGGSAGTPRELTRNGSLSYASLYFSSTPVQHPEAWQRLASLSDDSANYYWKLLAAREIMRLLREDRAGLERLAALHGRKASAEEVLHPPESTASFADPDEIEAAWGRDELVRIPHDPERLHFVVDQTLGEHAAELGRERELYRGLRPDALAVLHHIASEVHTISGVETPLRVTSAVRDLEYQRVLARYNSQAARNFSLHTSGFSFDVLREYGSPAQAAAFQFVLERFEILGLIAWAREPAAIHITVAADAAERLWAGGDGAGDQPADR